ncbi:ABC transporter ATP-binding protein [Sphingopyxis indica]|uniref:ABC transporter n=1 Tax=Sphingopyxis indica TaxID=436663 RepID=A0A239IPL0_9SPHN|nr:ABC transporter ATP-binding protein [Sphingopyxis indica]SNS95716.1 ABC transporter [Sphingopyxis indica]
MTSALRFDQVSLHYGARFAVSDVSLAIETGEILCLLGPSGCGKSSLVRLALGLTAPSAGRVFVDGREASVAGRIIVPPEQRGLSVVFQDLGLWPHFSVEAHLRFVLASRRIAKTAREPAIDKILASVELLDRRRCYPAELSGGERQRLAIARALVVRPRVVLLDEPLSNLDLVLRRELLDLFRKLFAEMEASVLYITHDIREAALLGDRVAVMEAGRLVATGTLAELSGLKSPIVREILDAPTWGTRGTSPPANHDALHSSERANGSPDSDQ